MKQLIFTCLIAFCGTSLVAQEMNHIGYLIKNDTIDTTKHVFFSKKAMDFSKDSLDYRKNLHQMKFTRADSSYLNTLSHHKFDIKMGPKVDFKYKILPKQKYYFATFDIDGMPYVGNIIRHEYPFNTNNKNRKYLWPESSQDRWRCDDSDLELIYLIRKKYKTIDIGYKEIKR